MKEAMLYQKLPSQKVRCGVCQRRCVITEGKTGYCKTRLNKGGVLYTIVYGVVSSLNNDPIEKKPVFHFKPGSYCLSLGTYGCNFRCKFCQNYDISFADASKLKINPPAGRAGNLKFKIMPEKAVEMAIKAGSSGIAITYNEPAIWLEYSLDVFRLAKKRTSRSAKLVHSRCELYTCWVSNGYATREAIDIIAPYLNVYRVDLKSFDDKFYQKLINVPKAAPIFETTKYLHTKYPKIHIECVTNIIPSWNDKPEILKKIACWIKTNLGPKTPWHVTRFYPCAELTNVSTTSPETLYKAREIGLKAGLQFVYIGNLEVDKEDDTFCPKCNNLAIRRSGYSTKILAVTPSGKCSKCGEDLKIKI